ncbi:MAG TPA: PDZ domain-containing protein [Planctomicrobium sp.]|nr:PDZ domain-containing protein [Planctomicrobium sp.]
MSLSHLVANLVVSLFLMGLLSSPTFLNAAEPEQSQNSLQHQIKETARICQPSIVAVFRLSPSSDLSLTADPLEDWLENRDGALLPVDAGGGIIVGIDADKQRLQVLTNFHFLNHSSSESADVVVKCSHWPGLKTRVVGADPVSQFAVLEADLPDRFPLDSLKSAELKEGTNIEQGEFSLLFSDPVALARQGTSGLGTAIIRRVGWRQQSISNTDLQQPLHALFRVWMDRLPESTATGSPVINMQGKLLGLVAALDKENVSGEGLEVLPITPQTIRIINDLKQGLEPQYGFLGLTVRRARVEELSLLPQNDPEISARFPQSILGAVRIESVPENFPLTKEELAVGDLILALNQSSMIHHPDIFYGLIEQTPPGETIQMTLWRRRTREIADVTVHSVPFPHSAASLGIYTARREPAWRGMYVSSASPEVLKSDPSQPSDKSRFRFRKGVLVTAVEKGSPAEVTGIQQGDLIERVGEREILNPADFHDAVQSWTNDTPLTISGRASEVFVPVQER